MEWTCIIVLKVVYEVLIPKKFLQFETAEILTLYLIVLTEKEMCIVGSEFHNLGSLQK